MDAFINALRPITSRVRTDDHWIKVKNPRTGKADISRVRAPLTEDVLRHHLNGGPACGACPVERGNDTTLIAMIDLDDHDKVLPWSTMAAHTARVCAALTAAGMVPHAWRSSGGRGVHVYLLWDAPQDAYSVRGLLRDALAACGLRPGTKGGVLAGVAEIFPKQDGVAEHRHGSMFVLPMAKLSVPLEPLAEYEPLDRAACLSYVWQTSPPVPVLEKPEPRAYEASPLGVLDPDTLSAFQSLSPDLGYEDWLKVGMALHYETGGSPDGLLTWDAWSAGGADYPGTEELEYKWGTFEHTGEHLATRSTIRGLAAAAGWAPDVSMDFDDLTADPHSEEVARASDWALPTPIDENEWGTARATPDCIVANMLFADVATLIAPGGMGKTTLILFKAIHIALGIPLFGLKVTKPGPVLILTAEDSRELLVARLRAICSEMFLSDEELAIVRERVRISDLSGRSFKLTTVRNDVVRVTAVVDDIIANAKALAPVLIVIDPAVSFGVGESRVNDAEQGLIEAARRLRNGLNCCVEYVHHSGKSNAREKSLDQYAGRGGSAFADGSRMVMVLQDLPPDAWMKAVGSELPDGVSGLVLARAKLSYAPRQSDIYLIRRGYTFTPVQAAASEDVNAEKIFEYLCEQTAEGKTHSGNTLETVFRGVLKQSEVRAAVRRLIDAGKLQNAPLQKIAGKGGAKTYLKPTTNGLCGNEAIG